MKIQERLLKFITRANWALLLLSSTIGLVFLPLSFAKGIIFGGLIVTVNFHLLYRTLKKSLSPPHLSSHNVILAKYYFRFFVSGLILFVLIKGGYVNPLGLFIGLSVVVASIMLATLLEVKKLIFKEAV
ncbi:MAG: ATP synthase subunit I [Deltaproteobacteria bacterium]